MMRSVSACILSLLPLVFAGDAEAAVIRFKVLMDGDVDLATGCSLQGMPGVDHVFTTEVAIDDAGARVARTTLSVCSAGVEGPEVEISGGTWPIGYQVASGATLVETSMPFSLFPGGVAPAQVRLGLVASQGAASHVALALPDGSSVIYPRSRGRRRAVAAPGEARVITLDGEGSDWNGLDALFDGIGGTGSPVLRMLKFFAFADQQTDTLFFRFDANLSSDAPFASDDVFARAAGEGLTVPAPGVLANDGDPNDLPLTALPLTPAAHGNVVLNPDGSFTYTPSDAAGTQTDAFEYHASNGTKSSNPARVEITVSTTGPSAPVASDDAWTTSEDEPLVIGAPGVLANDADPNADPLASALATPPPSHGSVVLHADGGLTYTPHLNYFGTDAFTYTVSDGTASDTAEVTITILSVNDPPRVGSMLFDVPENTPAGTAIGTVNVADADSGDSHTFAIAGGNVDGAFAIDATGTITVVNAAAIDFELHPQFVLTVFAEDDGSPAMSDTGTVTISVLDLNDLPVAAGQAVATNEDTPVAITLSATDQDGDPFVWTIVTSPAHGVLTGTAPNLTYTPAANYFGADGFTFRVNDGTADSAPATVAITLAGVNDAPVAVADAVVVDEASSVNGDVLANDSDVEGPLTAVLDANVAHGALTFNADGTFTYVHDGSETTSDSFTYHATDAVADSAIVTVSITINAVNDAPVNTVPPAQVTTEDVALNFSGVTVLSIADADAGSAAVEVTLVATNGTISLTGNDGLTFTAGANGTATMTFNGTIADINAALAALDFVPTPNFSGIATLTITTNDLGNTPAPAASDSDAITITVAAANDTPAAADDAYSVDEGAVLNEAAPGVLGNDSDVDSPITAVLVSDVTNGTLTLNADGSFTYTHDGSETTSDSFTYRATDGPADSAVVTASITINPVNDVPLFTSGNAVSVPENSTAVLTVTTSDAENDTRSYSISGGADAARFAIDATSGALSFTSPPDFEAPADADGNNVYLVEVTANDGSGAAQQTISVTVTGVDEAPVASDATFALDENSANGTAVGSVTAVDPDAGETLTYAITAGNVLGAFAIGATTGQITVADTTDLDFETNPTFSLTVQVTDDGALTDTAVVTVTLTNLNESPSITPQAGAATLAENAANGTPVLTVAANDPDAGQTLTYAITAGNTGGALAIDSSGVVTVAATSAVDFETNPTFTLTIEVSDDGTPVATDVAAFSINLTDVNEAPVVNAQTFSLAENSPNGMAAGTATFSDQDALQTHTFAITTGNDLGAFAINAGTGVITVADVTDLDFEVNPTFALTVEVTDDGAPVLAGSNTITINLTDANEAPIVNDQAFNVGENSAIGTVVGSIAFTDSDGPGATFSITAGNAGGEFAVNPATGQITVAKLLNFEVPPTSFAFTIQIDDGGTPAGSDTAQITIDVNDLNDAPVVDAASATIDENSANGTSVTTVTFTDPDAVQTHTFAITAGNTGGVFTINGSGQITVADVTGLNHEATQSFMLTVQITDNGTPALSDTATITVTVNDVNETPTAGTDAYVYIANTELRIGGHAGNPAAVASTAVVTNVLANDTDPDTLNPAFAALAITPVNNGASANGGIYSIAADGTMVYTPPAGSTAADSVTYSLTDGTNPVSGTINFTRDGADRVWYVKNDNAQASPTGTSTNPFPTLLAAQIASADNDIIYVLPGDGLTTGQNAGITLKNNQKLWGNGVPLIVDRTTDPDLELIPAGSQPQIGNGGGVGVTASNLTGVVQVRGLNIGGSSDAVLVTSNGAETIIANNTIRSAGNEGIEFVSATGSPVLSIFSNTVTANGTGISVTGVAAKTIRAFANNTITGNTAGSGIVIATATFDSSTTAGLQPVAGGTVTIGVLGNDVSLTGMSLTNVQGTLNLGNLAIYNANGAGLTTSGVGAGFTFTVNSGGAATGNVESTGGPALDLSATAADLRLVTLKSTNSATTGVSLTNVTGTVSAEPGSAITNATGTDFAVSGGTANVTYKGTVTDDVGQLVSISGATAGTKSFTGAITDGDDGDGSGISLSGNTGATIYFTGGIVLSTGANPAFAAAGGGTINVTGTNKLTTTTGTALNVANTTIGGAGLRFGSITQTGGTNAIVLNATGSSGRVTIGPAAGDGTCSSAANCAGGAIQNTTGVGVLLTDTRNVSMTEMYIANTGSHGVSGTGMSDVTSGAQPTFAFLNGFMESPGDGDNESALHFDTPAVTNITGRLVVSDSTIQNFEDVGLHVGNVSGTLTIDVTNVIFKNNSDTNGEEGIDVDATGTANTTVNVTGTRTGLASTTMFVDLEGGGLNVYSQQNGTIDLNVTGVVVIGTGGPDDFPTPPAMTYSADGTLSTFTFDITNNAIVDSSGDGIFIGHEGTISGRINNNVISGMATGDGIRIDTDTTSGNTVTIEIDNNDIGNNATWPNIGDDGIQILHRDGTKPMFLTITDNRISNTASEAVRFFADDDVGGGGPDSQVKIANNALANTATNGFDYSLYLVTQDTGTTLCTNVTGNSGLAAGRGIALVHNTNTTVQITQASEGALEAANGGAAADLIGTITFNGTCANPPLPTNP